MRLEHNSNKNIPKNIPTTWINKNIKIFRKILYDNKGIKLICRWFKKRVDFRNRIKSNHLKLEPLCCLQSCLIREGCLTVAVIEGITIVTLFICLFFNYKNDELSIEFKKNEKNILNDWESFKNMNKSFFIFYKIFIIIFFLYNIISIIFLIILLIGLYTFSKRQLDYFTFFSYFTIIFTVIFYCVLIFVMIFNQKNHWNGKKIFFFFIILIKFILHLWSISVTKRCSQFFNMIQVFVEMAEKNYP
uniref:Uncharacterized protein n=1 Tax=Strongyloides stercoralis TaxID=6248 RepID=A0A0K0ELD5_STRER